MKKAIFTLTFLVFVTLSWGQNAKYIFYFIGDGMGMNQVNGTETWLAEQEGRIGITPLQFAQFPHTGIVTTYSATNGVTDSAASGTALASGVKTKNGTLGLLEDRKTPVKSIAYKAQEKGMKVGITTTVSVDHATPAAFFAHQTSRRNYYDIGLDLITANFDFYAGSDFLKADNKSGDGTLYEQCEKANYTIVKGIAEYEKMNRKAKKMVLFQSDERNQQDRSSLPYAIDQTEEDLNQSKIVAAAIDFLVKKGGDKKGFFLMSEGGKIDFSCHANDGATTFHEVVDLDKAIKVAYEFYLKHPDKTLIVVTADHETGGMVLGKGRYTLNLKALSEQKMSINAYSNLIKQMRQATNNHISWEMIRESLEKNFGFWTKLPLTKSQEDKLMRVYKETIESNKGDLDKSLYQNDEPIATAAKQIINDIATLGWMSGGHSNGYVPVFAIGQGAELFNGRIDTTDIPKKIAKAAGITW